MYYRRLGRSSHHAGMYVNVSKTLKLSSVWQFVEGKFHVRRATAYISEGLTLDNIVYCIHLSICLTYEFYLQLHSAQAHKEPRNALTGARASGDLQECQTNAVISDDLRTLLQCDDINTCLLEPGSATNVQPIAGTKRCNGSDQATHSNSAGSTPKIRRNQTLERSEKHQID